MKNLLLLLLCLLSFSSFAHKVSYQERQIFKIVVFDQDKHSFIEAAMIEIECDGQKMLNMTDEYGYAYFSVPDVDMVSLKVSMTGYKSLEINVPLDQKNIYFVGLSSNRTEYFVL
jgi:hypothetical protein